MCLWRALKKTKSTNIVFGNQVVDTIIKMFVLVGISTNHHQLGNLFIKRQAVKNRIDPGAVQILLKRKVHVTGRLSGLTIQTRQT